MRSARPDTSLFTVVPDTEPCAAPPREQFALGVLASKVASTVPFALLAIFVLLDADVHLSIVPLQLTSHPTSLVPVVVVILSLFSVPTTSSCVCHSGILTALAVTGVGQTPLSTLQAVAVIAV